MKMSQRVKWVPENKEEVVETGQTVVPWRGDEKASAAEMNKKVNSAMLFL